MADGDFYSKYSGEEIEKKLDGSVLFNEYQQLTEIQKQQARRNIGAGTVDSGLIIKGYYASYEELTAAQPSPDVSDAYGVGTEPPYNIFVWDNVNKMWVNNGTITKGDKGDPGQDGEGPTAENIAAALGYTPAATDLSNVSNGAVSRSKLAQDTLYSPIISFGSIQTIDASYCGKTLRVSKGVDAEIDITLVYDTSIPYGMEFAVLNIWTKKTRIVAGTNTKILLSDGSAPSSVIVPLYGMAAAKLITRNTSTPFDQWYITGNVEVVK